MTNELRDKIAKVLEGVTYDDSYALPLCLPLREQIADRLIAAGLKFDTIVSHTATFDLMQQEQINSLERRCAQAEHRAEVAERALKNFAKNITCEDCPFFSDCASSEKMEDLIHSNYCFAEYLKQAEKELAEEGKEW